MPTPFTNSNAVMMSSPTTAANQQAKDRAPASAIAYEGAAHTDGAEVVSLSVAAAPASTQALFGYGQRSANLSEMK